MTHRRLLPILARTLHITDLLFCRFISFVHSCYSHNSYLLRFVVKYCIDVGRSKSVMGRNVMLFCKKYKVPMHNFSVMLNDSAYKCKNIFSAICAPRYDALDNSLGELLREVAMVRDGELSFSNNFFLANSELQHLIYVLASL